MGKKSRKGKAAWRRNIPTDDLEDFVERTGREERSGGAIAASTADDSLFFVDKAGDESVRRKIDRHREKVLRCDSVLQRSSLVPALPAPKKRKTKNRDSSKPSKKHKLDIPSESGKDVAEESGPFDLWEEDGGTKSKWSKHREREVKKTLPDAPAVEIDAPGCSYNPTYEDHQDALGAAVAQEMQQVYKKELEPEPIPLQVPGRVMDEEEMFFLEADQGDDNDDEISNEVAVSRAVKLKKHTRADLNKKARRKEVLKQEAKVKEKKRILEEINRIPEIKETIKLEDEEKEKMLTRRMASRKDRQASCPPRLGKHKFKPDSVKVLLSEEVTGSLRKLKGCYSLLRERYKSLQRRGLVEPRVPVKRKAPKMWVTYESGTKGAKEREAHATMLAEREAKKHALAVVPV